MWEAIVIIVIALLMVLAAPKPKIENARAANLGDFNFPRSKEGDPVPWFRGTVRLRSPNSLWFGDFTPYPIKKKQATGLFSSKKVIVGYKYHVGLDLCWALGGANTCILRRLWSDTDIFYDGPPISTASSIDINLPELFGGDEQRGGMVGTIDFYPGSFEEIQNSYLADKADPDCPAYIGQSRMVFRGSSNTLASGFYFGTSTSVDAISAEMSCFSDDIDPVFSIMPNGLDVNPFELLYAGFTQRFGMVGTSTADIDMVSWKRDAETLYNEGFGMSLLVQSSITGKDLCEEVLRIADGILYQDNETGKIKSCLIREDYVIDDLPVFDETVVEELSNFTKTTWDQAYNQCRVTFKDRDQDYTDRVATAQDFALINFQQKVRNTDISVPGCFVNEEGLNLATRQLSLMSVPLFQIEIRCNRKASLIEPGKCFVFNWPEYGLTNMVMRVQKIDKGSLTDGTVTISAVQDRFASALAVFAPPTSSGWDPVNTEAGVITERKILEVPFWFTQFAVQAPTNSQAMLMALASPPGSASVAFNAEITTNADSGWTDPTLILGSAPYYGTAKLVGAYAKSAGFATGIDTTGFVIDSILIPEELFDANNVFDNSGTMLFYIDGEILSPANLINNGDGTYSCTNVYRALLDTAFEDHADNAAVFVIRQADGMFEGFFSDTATWRVRLLDITPTSTLDPALAATDVIALARRAFRPAPPDFIQLNSSRTPANQDPSLTTAVSWRERNRKTLTLVPYNAATETAEPSTDYQIRWRLNAGAWSSYATPTGLTYTIPAQGTPGVLDVELYSRRDGLLSRVPDSISITLSSPTSYRLLESGTDRRLTETGDLRILE